MHIKHNDRMNSCILVRVHTHVHACTHLCTQMHTHLETLFIWPIDGFHDGSTVLLARPTQVSLRFGDHNIWQKLVPLCTKCGVLYNLMVSQSDFSYACQIFKVCLKYSYVLISYLLAVTRWQQFHVIPFVSWYPFG